LGLNITQHSSSVLAAKLQYAANAGTDTAESHSLSLAPVPALIPADMDESEIRVVRKFIGKITAYREVFGAEKDDIDASKDPVPLVDKLECVLTSTSTQERPLGFGGDNLIRVAGVPREKLNDLVVGDICGALIERPNLGEDARRSVADIRARWTGVTLAQLRACASRARAPRLPGVVVVAVGANKAPVVVASVRLGLVQHLFADQDLADHLEQICSALTTGAS
jgi:hypothetical protein